VKSLCALPGEPKPRPGKQIFSLKKVIVSKANIDTYSYLREGKRIRLKIGPLAGVESMLVEKQGNISLYCQCTSVFIKALVVERI
jgi:hypothetical protein